MSTPFLSPHKDWDEDSGSNHDSEDKIEDGGNITVRQKNIYGKSIQRTTVTKKKKRNDRRLLQSDKRVLFHNDKEGDSNSNSRAYNDNEEDNTDNDDKNEEEKIIMTVEQLLLLDDRALSKDLVNETSREKTCQHLIKRERAARQKKDLIRTIVKVKNGKRNPLFSDWRVIDDIDDPTAITAKQRPEEEIGVIDLDFNKLSDSDYPLVEVLLRFWPRDAIKQLSTKATICL